MLPSARRTMKVLAPIAATLGLLVAPTAAPAFDLDFGVRGWWPMNEGRGQTIYDWSGKGNHGRLGSTSGVDANDPTWIKGIFWGSGLSFDGDDFVSIPDSNALEPSKFTISMWVRAPESPGQFKYLLAKGSNQCVSGSYGIWTANSGGIEFYIWNNTGTIVRAIGTANGIWDGKWHNVTATYDGNRPQLFLDGKSLGEVPAGDYPPIQYDQQADGVTSIGGYRGSCDLLFTGDIDQVMMFDRVLPVELIWQRFGFILNKPTYQ